VNESIELVLKNIKISHMKEEPETIEVVKAPDLISISSQDSTAQAEVIGETQS